MKKCKIIAALLLCVILSSLLLTSCDDIIDDILGSIGLGADTYYLSGIGIGYAYNLIENDIYNVEKISANSVLDVDKLVELGKYRKTTINKTEVDAYSYSSNADKYSQAKVHIGFGAEIDYGIGNVKADVSGDLSGAISSHKYNHTYVVSGNIKSDMYVISDISSDEILKQCLSNSFVKDVAAVKSGKMPIEQLYSKYGTHAVVGVVTGGAYVAKYVVSTNSLDVSKEASVAFGLSTNNKLGKIGELNMKFDVSQNEQNKEKLEGTQTNLSMYYSGSRGAVTLEVNEFNDSIKTFEAGVEENAMPLGLSNNGTIPLSDLIRAMGEEYHGMANDFDTYLTKEMISTFVDEMNSQKDEYYRFNGLFTEREGGEKIVDENGNILVDIETTNIFTLYPQWTRIKVDVMFDAAGGKVDKEFKAVGIGSTYGELPTPTRSGHVFLGWYLNGQRITPETTVTVADDHTLNAQWLKVQETVTLILNETEISGGSSKNFEFHPGFDNNALINMGYTKFTLEFSIVAKGTKNTFDYAGDQPIVYVCSCYSDNAKNNHVHKKEMSSFENDYYETQTFSSTIKITDTLNGAFWIKVENSDSGKGAFNPSYPLYIQSITVVYTAQ
jgi:uncharacterized repeat protein (TIGR02543 family)